LAEPTLAAFRASDGYVWQYRRYVPDAPPRGLVVYLHGIQSHGGWYGGSCEQLRRAGYQVDFLDRRGSGLNTEARGDAPSFRRLLDDLAEFLQALDPPRAAAPRFLVAVSWGGKLAVALQRRHPGLVDGLALLCPGLFPQVSPSFLERLRILGTRLVRPTRRFPIPLNDPQLFTATPRWLEFLRTDPLALHEATARLLVESARLDFYLRFCPRHVSVPTLLMLAGKDRIIANPPTRACVERFATSDRTILEYPAAHHTFEFEPAPEPIIDDLIRWLDGQLRKIGRLGAPPEEP
jgi:alpha-beta hydrolase superfamily lysophospholipase